MRIRGMGRHWPSLDTIAIGQTVVVAVLLVTQFVPQPYVSSGVADQGGLAYGVPLASFVVMALSLAAGFGMLLTGAFWSGARLRYGILAVVTLLLAIQPVTSLISADAGRGYSLVLAFSAARLAILAVWWRWSTRPVLVWVLLPAYCLLVAGVWLVFAVHGRARGRDRGRAARPGRHAPAGPAGAGLAHPLVQHRLGEPRAGDHAPGAAAPGSAGRPASVFPAAAVRHRDHRGGAAGRGDPGRGRPAGWPGRRPGHGHGDVRADPAGPHRPALAAEGSDAVDIRRGRGVRDRLPAADRPRPVPDRSAEPPGRHGRGTRAGPAGTGRVHPGRGAHPEGP